MDFIRKTWTGLSPAARVLLKFLSASAVVAPSSFYAGIFLRSCYEGEPTQQDLDALEQKKLLRLEYSVQNLKVRIEQERQQELKKKAECQD
jgi:hypothetical protein